MLTIATPSPAEEVRKLSGGNRQKVMLGKIFAVNPILYILDEPTRGIDISAKKDILDIIKGELTKSAGVLMTSPGLEDLISVCDRILVLHRGRIIDEFVDTDLREADIFFAMQGK
jgi:ABC-type sugar transport system ATPase subunit